jgi:hypothetical protein
MRARGAVELAGHLGCRKHFSRDDLNVTYRRATKRVAPESGGTEGLLRAVNPARDVLKGAS